MTAADVIEKKKYPRQELLLGLAGLGVLAVVFALALSWAKWLPYARKAIHLGSTHAWAGGIMFAKSGTPGAAPAFAGAWSYTAAYFSDVWEGFLAALLIAAAVDALLPRAWLTRVMNRRTSFGQAFAGCATSLPSLMCTCCASPLTVGLRKRGVSTTAALAYWLGNPVLNPAVLVFLFLVAPWQFGAVRILVGTVVVVGGSMLATRLFAPPGAQDSLPPELRSFGPPDPDRLRQFPVRFARSLLHLGTILVPAYFAVILVIGYVSGWLSDFSGLTARLGIIAVLAAAVIGTLLVIPTGGEIPVVLALTMAGAGAGTAGALLITLPAMSIPSMVMVGRALSWRVTAAMAVLVAVAGLAAGALLWALT